METEGEIETGECRPNVVDGSKHSPYMYAVKPISAVNKMELPLGQVLGNLRRILVSCEELSMVVECGLSGIGIGSGCHCTIGDWRDSECNGVDEEDGLVFPVSVSGQS